MINRSMTVQEMCGRSFACELVKHMKHFTDFEVPVIKECIFVVGNALFENKKDVFEKIKCIPFFASTNIRNTETLAVENSTNLNQVISAIIVLP